MSIEIPADYRHLIENPNYGHLGTIRPDGTVQVNPMWFLFDGEFLRFTHTTKRAKYRNLQANPAMSLSVIDPDNPFHYLEARGTLVLSNQILRGRSTSRSASATATRNSSPRRTAPTASSSSCASTRRRSSS